jgi:hypothetical protein
MALTDGKRETIPTRAGGMMRDRTQRPVRSAVVIEAFLQHRGLDDLALMLALQNSSNRRNARITCTVQIRSIRELFPKAARRTQPQIHIVSQLPCPLAGTFAQVPFGLSLQPPSNSPK